MVTTLGLQPDPAVKLRTSDNRDVALLQALTGGSSSALTSAIGAELTGVMSEAAAIWGRRLSVAAVSPVRGVGPAELYRIGHGLAFYGEHVEIIDIGPKGIRLTPAVWWEVDGFGRDPDGWLYRADISTPDQQIDVDIRGAGVCHFRLPGREPWRGDHVLSRAQEFRALLAAVERHLVDEASSPSKHILPQPEGTDQPTRDELRADLQQRRTRLSLPATVQGGEGDGRALAPMTDWKDQRIRAEPDQWLVELRRDLREQVLHAYGIPHTESALRDPDRQLRQAMESVAVLVAGELTAKLEASYTVTLPRAPSDLAMLANAAAKLATVPADVRDLVGL